ncbi:MAG: hypothetical protein ICCCNLDF_03213 [Planctomycetes bacterium]|nr:hypothetical protein [Planctomycetota bacterium]
MKFKYVRATRIDVQKDGTLKIIYRDREIPVRHHDVDEVAPAKKPDRRPGKKRKSA